MTSEYKGFTIPASGDTPNMVTAFENYTDSAPLSGIRWPIDAVPGSPNSMDDEFTGTSLDAKWTQVAQSGSPTVTVAGGRLYYAAPVLSGWHLSGLTQPLPGSGDWEFVLAIDDCEAGPTTPSCPAFLGLAMGSSGATGVVRMGMLTGPWNNLGYQMIELSDWTTVGAGWGTVTNRHLNRGYLKVAKSGSNYNWHWSTNGIGWTAIHVGAGAAYSRIIIGNGSNDAAMGATSLFKWFRRTA